MKKIIFVALIALSIASANAQTVDTRRKIEVTGSAEAEVKPDIIYLSISLKEYMDGKNRVDINTLENQLVKAAADAGVPKEDLTINNISGYTSYQRKKDPNFLAGKQYRIKFHDLDKINKIISAIDAKGVQYTNIDSYEYSKAMELRKELKLKALIAAKDKAAFLLNGIGEKLGGAIEITEVDDNNYQYQPRMMMANAAMNVAAQPEQSIDFKNIKLSFQIKAVFEIVR